VREALPLLPDLMREAGRRAAAVERAVVDLVEALLLSGRERETFAAVAVDADSVQIADPAVRANVPGAAFEPGTEVAVRLVRADPAARTVVFEAA
jgi:hypothetical protein